MSDLGTGIGVIFVWMEKRMGKLQNGFAAMIRVVAQATYAKLIILSVADSIVASVGIHAASVTGSLLTSRGRLPTIPDLMNPDVGPPESVRPIGKAGDACAF